MCLKLIQIIVLLVHRLCLIIRNHSIEVECNAKLEVVFIIIHIGWQNNTGRIICVNRLLNISLISA
ncbi:hypothetical protein WT58_07695 [Burkholderia territorii]|nr:hypothetical protein WT58_07695 [Burkholderia territorii]